MPITFHMFQNFSPLSKNAFSGSQSLCFYNHTFIHTLCNLCLLAFLTLKKPWHRKSISRGIWKYMYGMVQLQSFSAASVSHKNICKLIIRSWYTLIRMNRRPPDSLRCKDVCATVITCTDTVNNFKSGSFIIHTNGKIEIYIFNLCFRGKITSGFINRCLVLLKRLCCCVKLGIL